jgi:hypothetical protein
MSNARLNRLSNRWCSQIPHKQILIIPNRTKQILMPQMPSNIFHNTFMDLNNQTITQNHQQQTNQQKTTKLSRKTKQEYLKNLMSIKRLILRSTINIPQTNLSIIRTTKQMTLFKLTPRQTIPFSIMSS